MFGKTVWITEFLICGSRRDPAQKTAQETADLVTFTEEILN